MLGIANAFLRLSAREALLAIRGAYECGRLVRAACFLLSASPRRFFGGNEECLAPKTLLFHRPSLKFESPASFILQLACGTVLVASGRDGCI